jgi:hypothetical protein
MDTNGNEFLRLGGREAGRPRKGRKKRHEKRQGRGELWEGAVSVRGCSPWGKVDKGGGGSDSGEEF